MGDRARNEARAATQLDSKAAVAFKAMGWVCQFNEIGVQYAHGFDLDCAIAAYKKAVELDPEDTNAALNLAIMDEYGHDGERYTSDAHLADAVAVYKTVKEKEKETGDQYEDNLLFDLLYNKQYKELLQELDKVSSSVTRDALGITATVALQGGGAEGIKAGISRAQHLTEGAQGRSSALVTAGNQLVHLRMYAEAAEILSAGVEGQSNAAGVTQQIGLFKTLTPWKREYLPASDPRSVVQRMFMAVMTGEINEQMAGELLARHAYASEEEWKRNLKKISANQGLLHLSANQSGLPAQVLLDVIAGNLKFSVEGDDKSGYRVSLQSLGSKTQQFFVSKEDGAFRVVSDGKTASEVGSEVLYLLQAGREAEARSLLDWMRDRLHKGGGDDPLSGPVLPRFWTVGDTGGPEAIQLAASSLLVSSQGIKPQLPALHAAWEKATGDRRIDLGLILANGYVQAEDGPALNAVSSELLAKYPDSYAALEFAGRADGLLKDWNAWKQMLESRIAKHPDDEVLLHLKEREAESEGDFAQARAIEQLVMDKGKATSNDYNLYAWTALFDNKVDADVVKAAQQANMLSKNSSYAELHTLACIYAVQGKTTEARELLLKAMSAANLSEPDSAIWFGFGSIYEQYGIHDAAIEAYQKVEKPAGPIGPTDTYLLAQMRLKALGKK
jgi:tetratricopeptide (TPR) repeat protein